MTAELLKNILPTYTATTTQSSQNSTSVERTQAGELFEKAFDEASYKYMPKDLTNNSGNNTAKAKNEAINISEEKESIQENTTVSQQKEKTSNFQKTQSSLDNDQQNVSDEKEKSSKTDITTSSEQTTEETQNYDTTLQTLYASIINDVVSDKTNSEATQNDIKEAPFNVITSLENTGENEPEGVSENTIKNTLSNTNQQITDKSKDTIIPAQKSANETDTKLNIFGQSSGNEKISQIQNDIKIDDDITTFENDILVKSGENISTLENDTISGTKLSENSKVSQETIESLDVTIRESESTGQNNLSNENNKQFHNSNSNAQEDIIKMSLEKIDTPVSEVAEIPEISETTTNTTQPTSINASNTNIEKALNITNTTAHSQAKTISNTDILNQISNNITLPKDNTTSKVNIILQPENLGKVSVEIMQTKDGLAAKMIAETPQVKELLDKSIESLKNTIASQGVSVNNISVKVEESSSSQNANFGFEQEQFNQEAETNSNKRHNNQAENQSQIAEKNETNNPDIIQSEITQEAEKDKILEPKENYHNGSVNITV